MNERKKERGRSKGGGGRKEKGGMKKNGSDCQGVRSHGELLFNGYRVSD